MIMGGKMGVYIFDKFFELAGGKGCTIVLIPTAMGQEFGPNTKENIKKGIAYESYPFIDRVKKHLLKKGAKRVVVLHTYDPREADKEEFTKVLDEAGGVYIYGGRQWRLADSYLQTRTHKALQGLLERSGVVAGSSAGASIQGSFLVRGDTRSNDKLIGDHKTGFGFLKKVAIDQHVLTRNRQFDMFEILDKHSDLLGLGLDENTGIHVHRWKIRSLWQVVCVGLRRILLSKRQSKTRQTWTQGKEVLSAESWRQIRS